MLSLLLLFLTVASVAHGMPSSSSAQPLNRKRTTSPDDSCGGTDQYSCPAGVCCSSHGFCGSTDAYCGTGCQPVFGTCSSSSPSSAASPIGSPTSPPGSTTLQDCLAAKEVPVSFVSSSNFATLAQPYNLRLSYTPAVIVLPTTVTHIADAVVCAGASNVKVQAKSGGHSYASYSSGGQSGSMVIDLEAGFQEVTLDEGGIARVNAGVRLGNMALAIFNSSGRALPHGTCPGVGIGGHASHGGFGYSSRAWGLTLDTIIAIEVVLANGTLTNATSTENSDMFYALRGAADSFGIITAFYLQTESAPSAVVNWQYSIPGMFTSAATSAAVFQHIQGFALNASVVDRNLGLGMYLDGAGFSISGTYFGSLDTFNAKIAPALLADLPSPSSSSVTSNDWIGSLTRLASPNPLQEPTTGYNLHDDFFAKSVTCPQSSPLTSAALTTYFDYVIQNGVGAPNPWFSIINLYGGPDSQINVPSPSASAYSDRSALWVVQHYGFTGNTNSPFPATSLTFVDGLNTALTSQMPGVAFGAYLNYVDPSLSPADAHSLYYGADTYSKLLTIKNVVDPNKTFWNPQSVGN